MSRQDEAVTRWVPAGLGGLDDDAAAHRLLVAVQECLWALENEDGLEGDARVEMLEDLNHLTSAWLTMVESSRPAYNDRDSLAKHAERSARA